MRYRRLSYRYAVVLAMGGPRPLGDLWGAGSDHVTVAPPRWRPPTDIYETPTAIRVTVELAGVDQEALSVLLYDDAVVIEGDRRLPACEASGVYYVAEIRQGPFRLEVPLSVPIDAERIEARYEHGLLQLMLLKSSGR